MLADLRQPVGGDHADRYVSRRWFVPASLLVLAIAAGWMVYHATNWGPWAFSDAAGYIAAARNLAGGVGLGLLDPGGEFTPGVSHPPLFVLVLTGLAKLGLDPLTGARWLHVSFFALAVAGGGLALWRATRSAWAGLLASGMILLAPQIFLLFVSAMSEPLFLVTGFASLLLLGRYLASADTPTLIVSCFLAALALLTRYVGIAFSATAFLVLAAFSAGGLRDRLVRGLGYLLGSVIPVGLFLAWSYAVQPVQPFRTGAFPGDAAAGLERFVRMLAGVLWTWKPVPPSQVINLLFGSQLVHRAIALTVGMGAISLVILFVSAGISRLTGMAGRPAPWWAAELALVFGAFIPIYVLVFLAAFLFSDPTPDVDSRTMLPLLPAILFLLALGIRSSAAGGARRWKTLLAVIGGLSILIGYAPSTFDILTGLHRTGAGYTAREWRTSPTFTYALDLPDSVPIITNAPEALLLYTGRLPYRIPLFPPGELRRFGAGDSPAEQAFREEGGLVVLLEDADLDGLRDSDDSELERYRAMLEGSQVHREFADGTVYRY